MPLLLRPALVLQTSSARTPVQEVLWDNDVKSRFHYIWLRDNCYCDVCHDPSTFGVPNEEFGEEVKAVVQAMPAESPGDELANELMAFCHEHLAAMKCPRSVDFVDELPRLPTGKLYKRALQDRYWGDRMSRIL
jgi:hypothetical protein